MLVENLPPNRYHRTKSLKDNKKTIVLNHHELQHRHVEIVLERLGAASNILNIIKMSLYISTLRKIIQHRCQELLLKTVLRLKSDYKKYAVKFLM